MSDVTHILQQIEQGDPSAAEELLPLVYNELRKLAAARMAEEPAGHTLQATALVHEAWLRLVGADQAAPWDSRAHFFAAAAEAMRRILVESARRKARLKRGGDRERFEIDERDRIAAAPPQEVLDVHEALDKLAAEDPQAAQLVKLRYFAGFSIEQAAELIGISRSSAYDQWAYARSWLRCALTDP